MPTIRIALVLCLLATPMGAPAQSYPTKPIRMIAPFAVGGATDLLARALCEALTRSLGKPCVVENRVGGGGIIGFEAVANAEPDGHTLLMAPNTINVLPHLHAKLPYDTERDFVAVARVASTPSMLGGHPSVPAASIAELLPYLKANSGKLTFGSCAPTSVQHLGGELLAQAQGFRWTHVPYKGCGQALTDTISGQVPIIISTVAHLMPQIKAGKLRGYAVMARDRSPFAPDIPSIAEAGVPGFDVDAWFGVVAPAKIPGPVLERLNSEINRWLSDPTVRERLLAQSYKPLGGTPQEMLAVFQRESQLFGKVIREAGIKIE